MSTKISHFLACLQAVICISVAILDGWKSEDLGRGRRKPPARKPMKSTPVHKQTGFFIARVVVKRTIRYYLMWSELVTQEILPQLKLDIGDVERAISRALSLLNFERKNDYFKARIGNHSDKSAKGRRCSSSFTYRLWKKYDFHRNCTVCERAKQTSFCFGHLPAQEHFIGLNCRAQGFMLDS